MALVLRRPGCVGGDITLFCLGEAGPAAPPGHQGQTEVPGPGLRLEVLRLHDLNARQGRATSQLPDTQCPSSPERTGVELHFLFLPRHPQEEGLIGAPGSLLLGEGSWVGVRV